jgi:hypothetical protein
LQRSRLGRERIGHGLGDDDRQRLLVQAVVAAQRVADGGEVVLGLGPAEHGGRVAAHGQLASVDRLALVPSGAR